MELNETQELRRFYLSFMEMKGIFDKLSGNHVSGTSLGPLKGEISRLGKRFPNLVPFSQPKWEGSSSFNLTAIRSRIAMIVSGLQAAIDQSVDTPAVEELQFAFIKEPVAQTPSVSEWIQIE
ncbi:MAG: hypothetical protein WC749_07150 [Dehalococcoidia bacterium]